ncbi:MAG: BrnT family toxin [Alphaproteobacteria bacterium]|jgi:uncharacterized DUF497 family protein|nr:BrnT family toxin [Alphaproteobacteria bacterium]
MEFEWDEKKRLQTIADRELDFEDAKSVFESFTLEWDAPRQGEARRAAVGVLKGRYITIIYVDRGDRRRIISMRPARKNEVEGYERARAADDC